MKKASEYMEHANECKKLANTSSLPEHKEMLLKMAQTWESLAREREALVTRKQRIENLESDDSKDPSS